MSRLAEALLPHAFAGSTYEPARDSVRLGKQLVRVRDVMADGKWKTLSEIASEAGSPEASVSARLRDLRKHGFIVDRKPVEGQTGLYKYAVRRAG